VLNLIVKLTLNVQHSVKTKKNRQIKAPKMLQPAGQ
jgi:hypothetical protein